MAMTRQVLITALFVTLFLLTSILLVGRMLDDKRQSVVSEDITGVYSDLAEIQTFFLLSETYGDNMACLAFEQKLKDLDASIWKLGIKLDQYRAASEEFTKSPFYLEQKRTFNENELVYMTLLQDLKERCGYKQTIVAFFYTNSSACPKCDDQSAVLTSINNRLDENVAIFSYDMDLGITSLGLIAKYYNVTSYPCTIVDGQTLCGIQSREQIMDAICSTSSNISECAKTTAGQANDLIQNGTSTQISSLIENATNKT